MWRPKGWENPYIADWDICKNMVPDAIGYEAGADGMLDALREQCGEYDLELYPVYFGEVKGCLVFIPDEEAK